MKNYLIRRRGNSNWGHTNHFDGIGLDPDISVGWNGHSIAARLAIGFFFVFCSLIGL